MWENAPQKIDNEPGASIRHYIKHGHFELHPLAGQALLNGKDLALTPKEFALLHLLSQYKGEVVHLSDLYEAVWCRPITKNEMALKSCISRLRGKLAAHGYDITSVRGVGYRLVERK